MAIRFASMLRSRCSVLAPLVHVFPPAPPRSRQRINVCAPGTVCARCSGVTIVLETIPQDLQAEANAALGWFNRREGVDFEITGIIDPAEAFAASGARELRLVLCGGDRCEQRSFRVNPRGDGYEVELVNPERGTEGNTPAELDPPPGARRGWLDRALAEHRFVVLIYYRGFW